MQYKEVFLRPGKEDSLKRFHPWVFSGAIGRLPKNVEEGTVVRVMDASGAFLGVGHYQIGSIAIRILSFQDECIDREFYEKRLAAALRLREMLHLFRPDNDTCRLVHGEGDALPGLIIDLYGNTAVMQAHSLGMHAHRHLIVEALQHILPQGLLRHLYYKSEGTLPYKVEPQWKEGYLLGGKGASSVALENGLKFRIDWLKGQKTGFFVDQRENRKLLEQYVSGRRVLNIFCYTGAFSVCALRGGATEVLSVDSSSKAVSLTEENVALNFDREVPHSACAEDAFKFLKRIPKGQYDLIILDPPAFAKHRGAVNNALQGYKKLNLAALEKLSPGGILFTFSCSQAITKEQFRLSVFSAAAISKRNLRILHQLTQPADHPINIYHPEGEYLKGLVLLVE